MGFVALAVAGALWGTPFVFGKWLLREMSVGHMLVLRFAFASLVLIPSLWREHKRNPVRIARRDIPMFVWAALLGVPVQFLVQFEGLNHTTVSHASLMVGLLPAILAAGAAIFSHERLGVTRWTAVLVSTVGGALVAYGAVVSSERGATITGDLLVVLSLFGGTSWVLLSQKLMQRNYSPIAATSIVIVLGTVMLAAWTIATQGVPPVAQLTVHAWLAVIAMGVLATAATSLLWNWGLSRVAASQAAVFVNLEPVVGTALGVTLFGDHIGTLGVIGGLLIVVAALVVARE